MEPFMVRAKCVVDGKSEDQLSFFPFDLIKITLKRDPIIWEGELNGEVGWLLRTNVEVVQNAFGIINHLYTKRNTLTFCLHVGDIVRVINPYHRDWWEVGQTKNRGIYPSTFIGIVENDSLQATALYNHEATDEDELGFEEGNVITAIAPTADLNWSYGKINDIFGVFPSNFVEFSICQEKTVSVKRAMVLYEYNATDDMDELSLEVGQSIDILEDLNNGWFRGRYGSNVGIFPGSFTDLESEEVLQTPPMEKDSKLTDQLICGICLDHAEDAVETSCCHHVFCNQHLMSVKSKVCPLCRKPFNILVAHLARRMISEMEVECTNESCDVKTTRSELKYHLLRCKYRVYQCIQCSFSGIKDTFGQHLVDDHLDGVIESCKQFYS